MGDSNTPKEAAKALVARVNDVILYPIITLLLTVALVIFLYGCFEFVRGADNPIKREQGKNHIIWGIVGMLIMISAWAILGIAAGTFGLDPAQYRP